MTEICFNVVSKVSHYRHILHFNFPNMLTCCSKIHKFHLVNIFKFMWIIQVFASCCWHQHLFNELSQLTTFVPCWTKTYEHKSTARYKRKHLSFQWPCPSSFLFFSCSVLQYGILLYWMPATLHINASHSWQKSHTNFTAIKYVIHLISYSHENWRAYQFTSFFQGDGYKLHWSILSNKTFITTSQK